MVNSTVKIVKSALTDFYSESEIQGAKERLLSDANKLKLTERWPHIPARRVGDSKLQAEIDDIFALST